MGHVYNSDFYDYINAGSRASARIVIPLMKSALTVDSLLDVGSGVGAWAAEWLASGTEAVVAVDGSYADGDGLLVPRTCFVAHDLSQPLALDRRFDLVQSLEVAEHLAEDKADLFVQSLTAHGDVILFSAAVPNQGGEHHVNEQPPEYWRRKFAGQGYAAFDWLRPRLARQDDVQPWYRYNSILYANAAGQQRLAADVLAARVPDNATVPVGGSLGWNIRRALIGLMPTPLVTRLAILNARHQARAAQRRSA